MYYYGNSSNASANGHDEFTTDSSKNTRDQSHLFGHSLDSTFHSSGWPQQQYQQQQQQQQQEQQQQQSTVDESSAPYLSYDMHARSLESSPFYQSDAFDGGPPSFSAGAGASDWDIFGALEGNELVLQQENRSFSNDPLDYHNLREGDEPLTSIGGQDPRAILLSDPNFSWQQQLLQDQQKEMQVRLEEEQQQENDSLASSAPTPSNLSAIFGQHQQQHQQTYNMGVANDSILHHQQPSKISKPTRKDLHRRSGSNVVGFRSAAHTNPIPISGKSSSSSSVPADVDHQRRFTELQARFRVNGARKPNAPTSTSSAAAAALTNHRQPSSSALFGSSLPSDISEIDNNIPITSAIERRRSTSTITESPIQPGSAVRIGRPAGNVNRSGMVKPGARNIPTNPLLQQQQQQQQQQQSISFPSRAMPIQIQRVHRTNPALPFDAEQRQRKLDEQLEKVDFDDITVSELKEMLRQRGKPATGKKAVLLQRLQEERDLIKAIKSGQVQRQYMPIPSPTAPQPITSPLIQSSSVPSTSGFSQPPTSPSSTTFSLNRSIANMHIGSPPVQQPRRFAPYGTSPRSPKMQQQQIYSSSMPVSYMSSSPNFDGQSLSQQQQQQQRMSMRYPAVRHNNYAPFASSALATPDREEPNPFDRYVGDHSMPIATSSSATVPPMDMEGVEWDPPLEQLLLQQGVFDLDALDKFSQEELMALFAGQNVEQSQQRSQPNELGRVLFGDESNHW